MTLTDERRIHDAWTGDIESDTFLSMYELGVYPELIGMQPITPDAMTGATSPDMSPPFHELRAEPWLGGIPYIAQVKKVVIGDPSTGMVESIRVRVGGSAFIQVEEDRVQIEPTFYRFNATSGTDTILVDLHETADAPESELDEYQQVIEQLRSCGRPIVAKELVELLHDIQESPEDEVEIQIYSLQAMARFLIEHGEFADPLVGPDPDGLMQVEWHIFGDGLLVMAFLEDEYIHIVAQAEPPASDDVMDISIELPMEQAAKEYGYLVPRQ